MSKKQLIGFAVFGAVDMVILLLLMVTMLRQGHPWEYIAAGYCILSSFPMMLFVKKIKKQPEEAEKKPKDREPWEK